MKRLLVVIPAYNASGSLPDLIKGIGRVCPDCDILVVDDGSSDSSRHLAEQAGTKCISHEQNLGKGAALISGFRYAVYNGYDAVITIDADLQHDPTEIPGFIDMFDDNLPVVIGRRRLDKNMPLVRKVSNSLSSFLVSLCSSTRIPDSQSGFRLIPIELLKKIKYTSSKYELEPELLIKAACLGYPIKSVPIRTIYNSSRSSINPLLDAIRFLKMLFKSLFW